MNLNDRLAKLEVIWPKPAPQVSRFHHPWLETVSDADLDVLDEVLSHLEAGRDTDTLSPVIRGRYIVLEADRAAWTEAMGI